MKKIIILSTFFMMSTKTHALDLKGKLLEVAKDKENQELAKEYAHKAIEYINKDKNEEIKAVPAPEAQPINEKKVLAPNKNSKKKTIIQKTGKK